MKGVNFPFFCGSGLQIQPSKKGNETKPPQSFTDYFYSLPTLEESLRQAKAKEAA